MKQSTGLFETLLHQKWTPEQKALMASTAVLAGFKVCMDLRVHEWIFERGFDWFRKKLSRRKGELRLGRIALVDSDRVRHSHIIGPPGSGKTELTKLLCFEDIKKDRGCFIIDPKGDRELYDEILGYCKHVGRENDLHLLSATYPEETSTWNPCALGNASELQSKFLNANIYSEPYYQKACEAGLLEAFIGLTKYCPDGFGLGELVEELKRLAEAKKSKDLMGLFYDFYSLSQSEWGTILSPHSNSKAREISLLDVVQNNQILFVHLPTEGKSVQSSRIGRLLTQELILISGLKKSFPELNQSGVFSIFVDEFDAFATDSFITFLNKGRSSNFMIHIAHQTLSDLEKISPQFAGQILGNCNLHFIFRHDDPDDAEYWSRFIGTKKVVKRTYQTQDGMKTGTSSNRETQEFKISPDEIKALGVGECIVSVKTQQRHEKVKLPLPGKYAPPGTNNDSARLSELKWGRGGGSQMQSEAIRSLPTLIPVAQKSERELAVEKWKDLMNV